MHFHGMVFNFSHFWFLKLVFWTKVFWTPSKAYLSATSKIQKLPLPHEKYLEDDFPDWIDDYGSLEGIIPIADLFKFKFEGRGFTRITADKSWFHGQVENFGKAQIDGSWGKNLMLKKNHYQARNEIQTYPTFKILKSVQMSWNPLSWRCSNENRENFFEYCFSSYRALDTVVENFKYFKVYAAPQILDLNVSKSVYDFLHLLACIFTTTMKHESSIVQIGPNYFAFFHLILI